MTFKQEEQQKEKAKEGSSESRYLWTFSALTVFGDIRSCPQSVVVEILDSGVGPSGLYPPIAIYYLLLVLLHREL